MDDGDTEIPFGVTCARIVATPLGESVCVYVREREREKKGKQYEHMRIHQKK